MRAIAVADSSAAAFRLGLAGLVVLECNDRWEHVEAFYSDGGAFPLSALPADVPLALCPHAWSGSVHWQKGLLAVHMAAAVALALAWRPRLAASACWLLHLSLSLRNTSVVYILDRCVPPLTHYHRDRL